MPTAIDFLKNPALGLVREARRPQVQMASAIQEVIERGGAYFCEGPVGIGKTFAYLVPSFSSGKRVVVATAKKGLQDQIYVKDLPAIARALGPELRRSLADEATGKQRLLARVLKGRGNYACRLLARNHNPDPHYLTFLAESPYGDRADYPGHVPPWWPAASAEGCIGQGCPHHSRCGYMRLKQEVPQARVVVANHHLLGADMFYGKGKILGEYDVLIVDEAHKLADGIRAAFTLHVSEDSVADLVE